MADTTLVQSSSNNGTVSPANPSALTLTIHNLAVLVIAVLGTNPTIATPGGWTQVQKTQGASLSFAMYILPNVGGGSTNPTSTLGGTVTGWVSAMFEFSATGANEGLLASNQSALAVAQLANIFTAGQQPPCPLLFVYSVGRATATITPQNSGVNWSASVQPLAGVQGLSLDTYWSSTQNTGIGPPYAQAAGVLSSAVNSVAIGAMLNSAAAQSLTNDIVSGYAGSYVGPFMSGMIGG